ncbi:MAG: transcription-repair coupling factor [Planctomycetota bacterium]
MARTEVAGVRGGSLGPTRRPRVRGRNGMTPRRAKRTHTDTRGPMSRLVEHPAVDAIAGALGSGRHAIGRGAAGSSSVFVAGALAARLLRPVVFVVAHLDDAENALDELELLGVPAWSLPALQALPGESDATLDLFADRVKASKRAMTTAADEAQVVVCPVQALMQSVPGPGSLDAATVTAAAGERVPPEGLVSWLADAGYERRETIEEPGEFAVRGGIVDVFPAGGRAVPVRLDFFGDEVDKITEIDLDTMGSDRAVDRVELGTNSVSAELRDSGVSFLELLPEACAVAVSETAEVVEQARGYYDRLVSSAGVFGPPAVLKLLQNRFASFCELNQFSPGAATADAVVGLPVRALPPFSRENAEAVVELGTLVETGGDAMRVVVTCEAPGEHTRLIEMFDEHAPGLRERVTAVSGYVHRGFVLDEPGDDGTERPALVLLPYHELVHRFQARRRIAKMSRRGIQGGMDTFLEFAPGDFVVHREHGIAQFTGLTLMNADRRGTKNKPSLPEPELLSGKKKGRKRDEQTLEEFLTLEFAGSSVLHVPATKVDQVQKYIGGFKGRPPLSTLGGKKWQNQKDRVAESVRDLAGELLRVRAAREAMPGIRYPDDTAWQREFEDAFPYTETEDQLAAVGEIKKDMIGQRPMDRLLCGDVGFGKTELAVRAAFKACEYGKQVAVLVPTTVLAEQHERTFESRFADFPFRVAGLSRFKTTKQINDTLKRVRQGEVDVVIGTHRLLSKDVKFADLGLVVIDEEQRFGVEHKERLLGFRMTADVLTLSATPIPRTLHMSMLGIRDISSLSTPPADRQSVVTEVIPWNARRIQQGIRRELAREGQVFYVHNRVHNIETVAAEIRAFAPGARVIVGHGQMAPAELEKVMLSFMRREADILVSTTIIESGIDIPTANTMFIADADRFGLAELHQLRGRVGRYKHRAYCYMLLPPERTINEVAVKRLKAIEQYSMLGAGFKISMRDLEIRGAGNILGSEQSGHIASVGYEMYCQLLEEQVRELKGEAPPAHASRASVEVGLHGYIPRPYIPSDVRRLDAYRRASVAASGDDVDRLSKDLTAAYGDPPQPVERLLRLARLRVAASALGVGTIVRRDPDVVLRCHDIARGQAGFRPRQGTIRRVDAAGEDAGGELFYRPPESYLEPESLVTVLLAALRLVDTVGDTGSTAASSDARQAEALNAKRGGDNKAAGSSIHGGPEAGASVWGPA